MVNVLIIAIFLIPWLILPVGNLPDPTRLIKATCFDLTMLAIIALALLNGVQFNYKNKYLSWMFIYGAFIIGWNWYYPILAGFGYNSGTIEASLHFILATIGTFLVCSTIERKDFVRIAKATAYSIMAVSIFGLFQAIGLDPMAHIATYGYKDNRHVCALLDHPTLFGNYIALGFPFFLYLKGLRFKIGMVLAILGVLAVHSSLSVIAIVVSTSMFIVLKYRDNKRLLGLIAGAVLLFTVFCFFNHTFNKIDAGWSGRIPAWKEFITKDTNYIFGGGLGVAKAYGVVTGNKSDYWMFCHNDYLEIFLALGFIGTLLFFLTVIHSFRNFDYNRNNHLGFAYLSSFTAFLILMFGSFPMEIAPLALGGLIAFWGVEKI